MMWPDIDAVVMSHAHIDHLGGNVGDDGKSNFPNAQFYIQQSDLEFWTDEKIPTGQAWDQQIRERIAQHGVDYAQGYAIGRAEPFETGELRLHRDAVGSHARDQLTAVGGDGTSGENRRRGVAFGLDRDPRQ